MKLVKCCLGAAAILMLAGCVTPQPLVKDVLKDPEGYLTTNLTEAKLSESVRQALGIKTPGNIKRRVQIDALMTNFKGEEKESFEKTYIFHVLDNGLVRNMSQTGRNGILSLTEFELDYYDVFNLIYQSAVHSASNLYQPTYTKAISRLDKGIANPSEDTEYVFEYALAPEVQIVNFQTQRTVCKTGKWFPAKTLHNKLTGRAMPVDCEYFGTNNQTFLKMQSVFLEDLGVTMKREGATSTLKRTWTITDVK